MSANINLHQPRVEHAFIEPDDENNPGDAAPPDGQTTPQSETTVAAPTEQQGQSSGDGGSRGSGNNNCTHDPANALPPPVEAEAATRCRHNSAMASVKLVLVARITHAPTQNGPSRTPLNLRCTNLPRANPMHARPHSPPRHALKTRRRSLHPQHLHRPRSPPNPSPCPSQVASSARRLNRRHLYPYPSPPL